MGDDPGRLYRLDGVAHIAGVINDEETFGECPVGADDETVRRFARAYIMMLLGTQLFADKSGNRIHIRWLPFVARLEEMGGYSWGSAALAWLYRCMCRVANRHVVKLAGPLQLLQSWIFWRFPSFRPPGYDAFSWPLASRWSGYNPGISNKGPRVQMARLKIDLLQPRNDGRGGDRWFPAHLPDWHLHWQQRAEHILQFDIVADPGPSHDFLAWWHQHGKRFLSPEMYLGDPRGIPIPEEATQRGVGRVPEMDRVHDVPDRRRVERRARVGTRRSQRENAWLDHAMEEVEDAGRGRGRRRGRGGRRRGAMVEMMHIRLGGLQLEEVRQSGLKGPIKGGMMVSGMDQVWEIPLLTLTLGLEIISPVFPVTIRHFRTVLHRLVRAPCFQTSLVVTGLWQSSVDRISLRISGPSCRRMMLHEDVLRRQRHRHR
ncbi:hypothetical protein Ahy_B09g095252 [Arachis hypogaea]|uniref:Aminotransferase-like plant mobile domain-containing protein n=1 Tax=Arachis hypogaea TaxID=3818 RepID=A0A444XD98_ARAHY|nr:hypothetical protein Ahy_B09g095252 [Arachis hypogaea]